MTKKSTSIRKVIYRYYFGTPKRVGDFPRPRRIPQGNIAIWMETRFDEYSKKNKKVGYWTKDVHIAGDKKGLKYLATLFLIAADADKYDPEWHWHLIGNGFGKNIKSHVDMTIHAPHAHKGIGEKAEEERQKRPKFEIKWKKVYGKKTGGIKHDT